MYDQACFADRSLRREDGTVNFLGLFALNRRLISRCLPGINAKVSRVRVYAAFCWMAWRLEESLTEDERHADVAHQHAMQKMDLVLMWCMHGSGVPRLVGAQRRFPADDVPVTLTWDHFPDSQATYLGPTEYRPSLVDGLGLLQAGRAGSYRCHPEGRRLARALDAVLRREFPGDDYAWLADVHQLVGSGARAKVFRPLFTLPLSEEEQHAFLAAFLREGPAAVESDANRTTTCRLLMRALGAAEEGLTVEALRAALARGTDEHGAPLLRPEDGACEQAALIHLAALQVRQLQRYALERAAWRLLQHLRSTPATPAPQTLKTQLHAFLAAYLTDDQLTATGSVLNVAQDLDALERLRNDAPTLALAAQNNPEVPSLAITKDTLGHDQDPLWLARLYRVLLCCKAETDNLLQRGPEYQRALAGEAYRQPLPLFSQQLERFRAEHPRALMAYVLEQCCVYQQLRTAAANTDGPQDKNRFLFVQGDQGWTTPFEGSLDIQPTSDRLDNTCWLLRDGGLLVDAPGRWFLSQDGLDWLEGRLSLAPAGG